MLRDVIEQDLGHLDNLLRNAEIERRENTKEQLFHHQRHRNVESRKQRSVDHLVHGVPLDPCLRPRVCDRPRPCPHPGAGDCLLAPRSVVRGALLGVRMVGPRSQHRSHRLLLVSPPRAQMALPPPHGGSSTYAMVIHGTRQGFRKKRSPTKQLTNRNALWWLWWLWWLQLVAVGCGWLQLVVVGCGWLWLVVVGCGWLWLVVVGCGWLWLLVVACGCLWLVVVGCGWL